MPPKIKFTADDIVDAAFQIVRRHGWKGLSARAVAHTLNASTRPIYDHFRSMKQIENAVIKKAMDVVLGYMNVSRTGDPWIDQAVGVVMFAKKEKHLFRAVFDENVVHIRKHFSGPVWKAGEEKLSAHPRFEGLSKSQVEAIRRARWIFTHGLASLINISNWPWKKDSEAMLIAMIQRISHAVYREFKDDPDILLGQAHFRMPMDPKE